MSGLMDEQGSRKVIVKALRERATAFAAELFKTMVCEAVGRSDSCCVALAGGTTPHSLYRLLAEQAAASDIPWSKVHVFFGDERDVPHDDVESNYGMAQRTLLDHVPVDPARVHPMRADVEDLPSAAQEYEQLVRRTVPAGQGGLPSFDIILLGMGGDGHTASLFPGTRAAEENEKLVVAYFVPVLGRSRMTFTFPLINAARNLILLVTGDDKAEAVARLLRGEAGDLPAGKVAPKSGTLYVVLDGEAARLSGLSPEWE
jgi:6-phosphogluconolactonase